VYQDESSDELSDVIDSLLVPSHDTDDELEQVNSFFGDNDDNDDDKDEEEEGSEDDVIEVNQSEDEEEVVGSSDMEAD
jgi:hypothetical protein